MAILVQSRATYFHLCLALIRLQVLKRRIESMIDFCSKGNGKDYNPGTDVGSNVSSAAKYGQIYISLQLALGVGSPIWTTTCRRRRGKSSRMLQMKQEFKWFGRLSMLRVAHECARLSWQSMGGVKHILQFYALPIFWKTSKITKVQKSFEDPKR